MASAMIFSCLLIMILYSFVYANESWVRKTTIVAIGFFMVYLVIYSREFFERYVEFNTEFVCFNSYRLGKQVRKINIHYEDILSLESTKIPLLGIYKVKVKAKNVPWIIPVTWCMAKKNDLFGNLCIYAKKHNPQVYIDSRLTDFLEKKGYCEFD